MKAHRPIRDPVGHISQIYSPNVEKSNPYAKICLKCPTPDKPCKKGICAHFKKEYHKLKEKEANQIDEITPP